LHIPVGVSDSWGQIPHLRRGGVAWCFKEPLFSSFYAACCKWHIWGMDPTTPSSREEQVLSCCPAVVEACVFKRMGGRGCHLFEMMLLMPFKNETN
jgi:hypothetical protein